MGLVRRGDCADRRAEVHPRRGSRSPRRAATCREQNDRPIAWLPSWRWPGRLCLACSWPPSVGSCGSIFWRWWPDFAWPFALLLGLLMAILLIGALVGWPLMWATVAVEGTDAFDALSRSYAYTYQRPLRLLWYVVLAAVLAAVSMFIVKLFATSAISLGNWSISWGLDKETYRADRGAAAGHGGRTRARLTPAPVTTTTGSLQGPVLALATPPRRTKWHACGWPTRRFAFGNRSWAHWPPDTRLAFCSSRRSASISLLRKDIDGAEMDEVYVEDEPEFGMPPLADDHVTGVPEVQTDLSSPESTTVS